MTKEPPLRIVLEPFTPGEHSLRWRLADAYYQSTGIEAWTSGDVPHLATSNYPAARQHALVVTRAFVELERAGAIKPGDPVHVLEVGSGSGRFAIHFLRALARGAGADGKRLFARIKFLLSDFSEANVREVIAQREIAQLIEGGRIVPALFDVRDPASLRTLDGTATTTPLTAVIANYVCCVIPPVIVRKEAGEYFEQWLELSAELSGEPSKEPGEPRTADALLEDYFAGPRKSKLAEQLHVETSWRPIDLEARFGAGTDARLATDGEGRSEAGSGARAGALLHAHAARAMLADYKRATVVYPRGFIDLMAALPSALHPGGILLVSDYGSSRRSDGSSAGERRPQRYGRSYSHGVNFALFDVVSRLAGWSCERSMNPVRSVHAACVRFGPAMGGLRSAFHRAFKRHEPGEDFMDFRSAGIGAFDREEWVNAVRFFRRCLRLDPESADVLFRVGRACLENGATEDAFRYLARGRRLEPDFSRDFDFLLGRVCHKLGKDDEALGFYRRSLEREEHHVTLANIGIIHSERREFARAEGYLRRSVEISPGYQRAIEALDALPQRSARG